jgi:uncharacterized delta-60 repeat protein
VLLPSNLDDIVVLKRMWGSGSLYHYDDKVLYRWNASGVKDLEVSVPTEVVDGYSGTDRNLSLLTSTSAGLVPIRYTANGQLASSFVGKVQSAPSGPYIFRPSTDGRLLAVGVSLAQLRMRRWNSDGSIDISVSQQQNSIAQVTSDAIIGTDISPTLNGGALIAISTKNARILTRLGAEGAIDRSFGINGYAIVTVADTATPATYGAAIKLATQPDGKILLLYSLPLTDSNGTSTTALAVARFNSDGSPDTSFTRDHRFDSIVSLPGAVQGYDLALLADGAIEVLGKINGSALILRLVGDPKPVVEFYNTPLDNYFITTNVDEAAAIDNDSAGPGWIRTGYTFKSGGSTPVCRFYGSQSPGPNSHFYTVIASECQGLKDQQFALNDPRKLTIKNWNFESYDFLSTVPVMPSSGGDLTCPSGLMPIYRAYNNGSARGIDSNHRITSSLTAIQQMVAKGWISEGVVMCAPI